MNDVNFLFGIGDLNKSADDNLTLDNALKYIDCKTDSSLIYWVKNTTCYGRVEQSFGANNLPHSEKIKTILEIGCSHGLTTKELARTYPYSKITAMDIASENIEHAKALELNNVTFYHSDGYYPNHVCNAESQDIVFMMNNISHLADKIGNDELSSIILRVNNVIKPSGFLMISSDDCYLIAKKIINKPVVTKVYKPKLSMSNNYKIEKLEQIISTL